MAKKTKYEIRGKRWRDSFGNTYHTAEVSKFDSKGKEIYLGKSDITYGYDDAYIDTANKIMYPKEKDSTKRLKLWVKDRDRTDKVVFDVNRKKDL